MSFQGTLLEFPHIAVDRFNITAELYLLTHFHKDHLIGLSNQSFHASVICSHATKQLARLDPQIRHKITQFRAVPYNQPQRYVVDNIVVEITLIPAYHCPGSTMFLIKSDTAAVLFTGDLRAERWWVQRLPKNVHLLPYTTGLEVLDNIYLDTTFAYRGEPYIEIPHNHDGVAMVVSLLRKYPKDADTEVYFRDHVLGFDEAWSQVVEMVGGRVHFDDGVFKRHQVVDEYATYVPLDREEVTKGGGDTPLFHVCNPKTCPSKAKFKINVRQAINFNILDLKASLMPVNLRQVDPQELTTMVTEDVTGGYDIVGFRGRKWLKVGTELLPQEIKLIFSRHSSYTECKEFVGMFRPKQVYPLTESHQTWCQGFLMSRAFGAVCLGTRVEDFVYDFTNATTKEIPPPKVLTREVVTVDRWLVEGCRAELKFVESVLEGTGITSVLSTAGRYSARASPNHAISSTTLRTNTLTELIESENTLDMDPTQQLKLDPTHLQLVQEQVQAIYKKYINLKIPGHRIAFEMSFDSSTVLDISSQALPALDTTTTHVTEFGTAQRLPTVEGAIPSSFTSECSYYHDNRNVDEVSIARICTRLKRCREDYFLLTLECLQ